MESMERLVRKGVIRVFIEVRYDLPFSFNEPVPLKTAVNNVIGERGGFRGLPEHAHGKYAEVTHAILVDTDEPDYGKEGVDLFEYEELTKLLYD